MQIFVSEYTINTALQAMQDINGLSIQINEVTADQIGAVFPNFTKVYGNTLE